MTARTSLEPGSCIDSIPLTVPESTTWSAAASTFAITGIVTLAAATPYTDSRAYPAILTCTSAVPSSPGSSMVASPSASVSADSTVSPHTTVTIAPYTPTPSASPRT